MLPARLNRILPWIFLATGILAVIQLISVIGKFANKSGFAAWFMHHRLEIAAGLGVAAALTWLPPHVTTDLGPAAPAPGAARPNP